MIIKRLSRAMPQLPDAIPPWQWRNLYFRKDGSYFEGHYLYPTQEATAGKASENERDLRAKPQGPAPVG